MDFKCGLDLRGKGDFFGIRPYVFAGYSFDKNLSGGTGHEVELGVGVEVGAAGRSAR